MVVGLKGTIDEEVPVVKNWKWETSYNYGRSDLHEHAQRRSDRQPPQERARPELRRIRRRARRAARRTAPIAGCVPLNLFTPGQVSPDAIKYLTFTSIQSGLNEQHTAQATTSGKLVDLPNHGDISVAVGGDYRFEKGAYTPDPLTATGDTTGNASAPTLGSYHAFEGFGEVSIVPVSGLEYLKWVELDAAARAYDYNTFGSGVTAKVSGLVRTAGGIAVRGTYGNAFRAPNVGELFAGQADGFAEPQGPVQHQRVEPVTLTGQIAKQCMNQGVPTNYTFSLPQIQGKFGGNPSLSPETAAIGTAGVVYEPVKGLDFTLDYWHIGIDNAIQTLNTATILAQCYQGGVKNFCDEIVRDGTTHTISQVTDLVQNVGAVSTSGLDFSAAYQYRNNLGTFRHALEGTYLFKYNIDTGTVDPDDGQGEDHPRQGLLRSRRESRSEVQHLHELVSPVGHRRGLQRPVRRLVPGVRQQQLQRSDQPPPRR